MFSKKLRFRDGLDVSDRPNRGNKAAFSNFSGLILEKIYELFVETNKTVRYKRVSVLSGCL